MTATLPRKLFSWLRPAKPQSLFALIRNRRDLRPVGTEKLFVMRVNFPLSPEKYGDIDKQLEPLRKRYGLDFLVLEPGIELKRFDDI